MSGGTMQTTNSPNMASMPMSSLPAGVSSTTTGIVSAQPPPQQQNVLLNQALGPVSANQTQNQFIANNLQGLVQNSGPQMPNTGQTLQQPPQQTSGPTGPNQQQFGLMQNQMQGSAVQQLPSGQLQSPAPRFNLAASERQKNLLAIQQLEQTLNEAKRKEMEFQQQQHHHQPPSGQTQGVEPTQQQTQQQLQQNQIRQTLQQQLQQKHLLQQQQHQHQQQQQQQQQQVTGIQSNPQLRHLLQQHQQQQQQQQQMRATLPQQQILVQQQNIGLVQQQGGSVPQFRLQNPALNQLAQQQSQPLQQNRPTNVWDNQGLLDF